VGLLRELLAGFSRSRGLQGFSPSEMAMFVFSFMRPVFGSHWRLERYLGLVTRPPSLLAGVLDRDFKRGRGDETVLAARDASNRS
jgi:hypothetical protein